MPTKKRQGTDLQLADNSEAPAVISVGDSLSTKTEKERKKEAARPLYLTRI